MKSYLMSFALIGLVLWGCGNTKVKEESVKEEKDLLKESLLLYASFDNGIEADFAKGDSKLYDSPSRRAIDTTSTTLSYAAVTQQKADGVSGGTLQFNDKTRAVAYFKSQGNLNYSKESWEGTISFWLKLTPDEDLKAGYCDPIQITDVSYNDAAIWVDFTKELPRQFRLGVMGDLSHWNPEKINIDDNPEPFENRMFRVNHPPFSRDQWTHVVITHEAIGSQKGKASLYLNGSLQGSIDQTDPFTWELEKSNIYLGLSYIGLFDELSIYNRPLNTSEIKELSNAEALKKRFSL